MVKVILLVAALGLMIFALIDLWQVPAVDVRGGNRFLWTLAILLLPVLGAATWLWIGRSKQDFNEQRHSGPDDDPDFLRGLRP